VKTRDEIAARLRALKEEIDLRDSYNGPDPSPDTTLRLKHEAQTLLWVLGETETRSLT
jgi:hypothetical protein